MTEVPACVLAMDVVQKLASKEKDVMFLLEAAEAGAVELFTPAPTLTDALKSVRSKRHAERMKKLIREESVGALFTGGIG